MMGLRRTALVVALCASVAAAACGFSEPGALEASAGGGVGSSGNPSGPGDTNGGADGSSPDTGSSGTIDSGTMGVPICSPPTCALPTPSAGWELVLFGTSTNDACPTGFDSTDHVESPSAGADACACGACTKTGTNCSTGAIPTAYDNGGGACGIAGAQHETNGGLCRAQSGNFGVDARVDAPTAVPGTCSSVAAAVPAKVVTQARRLCKIQQSACTGAACAPPGSLKACLAAPGDVACPSGTKHLVGSGVTAVCPPCGCTIASATCGGTLSFYPGSNCSGTPVSLNVGVCKATGSASFVSTKWTGTVASETCVTTPVAPTTTLTSMQTVCCP
jgi:hypothetical protein